MSVNNLYILIIFLPFYSAFIVGFFGRLIGRRGSIFVSVGNLIVAAALSWFNLISDKLFAGTVSIDFGLWCFSISNIQ
jgi:NADH-quinone oxidoreductase subunit L